MGRSSGVAGVLAFSVLTGCVANGNADADVPVGYSALAAGDMSGIVSQRFEVVRDPASLAALWAAHTANVSPKPAAPGVDFDNEMAIALFLGAQPTGGYGIEVAGVTAQGQILRVAINAHIPGDTCITTQAFTQPYQLIVLPRSQQFVTFDVQAKRVECNGGAPRTR